MVNCTNCGSNKTESLGINKCNVCHTIFFGDSTAETDMDIIDVIRNLCGQSSISKVYFALMEAGGAQRFTDIQKYMKISRSSLHRNLQELLRVRLVRKVGKKYQAIVPTWMMEAEGQ